MIFAAQNQLRRDGRKTIYKYRGRHRTDADVAHYWSRKKEDPEDFPPVPHTPAGLEYWTPGPTPDNIMEDTASLHDTPMSKDTGLESSHHDSSLSTTRLPHDEIPDDAEGNSTLSSDDTMSVVIDWDDLREYGRGPASRSASPFAIAGRFLGAAFRGMPADYQSTLLQPLESPGNFRRQEHIVRCSKEYFLWWVEKVHWSGRKWDQNNDDIWDFRNSSFKLLNAIIYGHSKYSIEMILIDTINLIPHAMQRHNPYTLFNILEIVSLGAESRSVASSYLQKIMARVSDQASNTWGKDHPSTILLEAISDLDNSFFDFSCALLPAKDILGKIAGENQRLIGFLVSSLAFTARQADTLEELSWQRELYQMDLAAYQANMTDNAFANLVESLSGVADSHTRLGNYNEADILLRDGFERLQDCHDAETRSVAQDDLLFSQAYCKYKQGEVGESLNSFNESLSIRLRLFGPDHYLTMETAESCRILQNKLDKETRRRIEAGFVAP